MLLITRFERGLSDKKRNSARTGKKGKGRSKKQKKLKNGKKKMIKGNRKVAKSQGNPNTRSEDPLNKGPYGFEHPDAIDVNKNLIFSQRQMTHCTLVDPASVSVSRLRGHDDPVWPVVGASAWPPHPSVSNYIRLKSKCQNSISLRICSSNLSDFTKSPSFNNFGPNITLIYIPGSVSCPERSSRSSSKQFGVELTMEEADNDKPSGWFVV